MVVFDLWKRRGGGGDKYDEWIPSYFKKELPTKDKGQKLESGDFVVD